MRKTVLAGLLVAGIVLLVNKPTANAQDEGAGQNQNTNTTSQQVIVEVEKGDNLSKIANKHQTTYVRLFDANEHIKDPDIIHPGEKVRIPDQSEQLASRTIPAEIKPVATNKPKAQQGVKSSRAITRTPKTSSKPQKAQSVQVASGSVWDDLARCESGGNWAINTGNGYYGGLQFTASTWKAVGGSGLPHQNSKEEQIHRAQILQARSGWGQWPACTKKLGLR